MRNNSWALGQPVLAFLIWLVFLTQALAIGQPPLIRLDDAVPTNIETRFLLHTEPEGQLDIADVLQLDEQHTFQPAQRHHLNSGYFSGVHWLKVTLQNQSDETDWYLVGTVPYLQLKVYRQTASPGVVDNVPGLHDLPAVPIHLKKGILNTFFIRLQTPYLADLQFKVMNKKQLIERRHSHVIFLSIITGCFLAMVVYNFFLLLILQDRTYFHYLLFALINIHFNLMTVDFPSNIQSWFGVDWLAIMPLYLPLASMTTLTFTRSFLQTRQHLPHVDKVLRFYAGGLIVLMLAYTVMPRTQLLNLQNLYWLLGTALLLLAGLLSLRKGFKPAAYFLAGVGIFLIGMLILLSKTGGLLPSNDFTNNAHLVAHAVEMLMMSLAIGGRIRILEDAKARAEITAQVKSRLLRIISHDIATPLTVVKATAYHLRKDAQDRERVERIIRAAAIIEDIVSFVRKKETMESRERLELGPVLLKNVFDELAFLFQEQAWNKRIQLNFSLEHPDIAVLSEPVSLSNEVLGNLISNAIKFSFPESQVDIQATKTLDDKIIISVRDQGIGMDALTLKNLFDPARKQSRQGTGGEKGIGFGMPLAKAYIDAYAGKIEVTSRSCEEHPLDSGTMIRIALEATLDFPES